MFIYTPSSETLFNKAHQDDFLCLPNGDYVLPEKIEAIRLSEKANRSTGEVGASVIICVNGSWYTVRFETNDIAKRFAEALAKFSEAMRRRYRAEEYVIPEPTERERMMATRDAEDMISRMTPKDGLEDHEPEQF